MLLDLLLEVFSIRIKIKGYLENITENTKEIIDIIGIKNKNNLKYKYNDTNYKIIINDNKIELIRENDNFIHKFIFEAKKETDTIYFIKEYNTDLVIPIMTNILNILDDKIEIIYKILDSNEEYKFLIEMRQE